MSDGAPEGAVGRLLHELTVGMTQAVRTHDVRKGRGAARERELQFQFQISGNASSELPLQFEEFTIEFDYAFLYAPGQRESTLEEPHFTFGSHTAPAVGVLVTVVEWLHNEANGAIIGAVVAVAAFGLGEFKGMVHLTFQGYAALIEEDQTTLVTKG